MVQAFLNGCQVILWHQLMPVGFVMAEVLVTWSPLKDTSESRLRTTGKKSTWHIVLATMLVGTVTGVASVRNVLAEEWLYTMACMDNAEA